MAIKYSYRFDAKYDDVRDVWLESKCSDTCYCEFCSGRPDKPSQMTEADKAED